MPKEVKIKKKVDSLFNFRKGQDQTRILSVKKVK